MRLKLAFTWNLQKCNSDFEFFLHKQQVILKFHNNYLEGINQNKKSQAEDSTTYVIDYF